jgi:MoaA/NifB/PqqE/SkfB family radical SAM enzyme
VLERSTFYAKYAARAAFGRQDPLICGIAVTDRCNFSCVGCHVSNTGDGDMSFAQLRDVMQSVHDRGYRELYFTGGEPMLWHDGELGLDDLVAEARRIGFFHVHVYTNGTLGLDSAADLMWVSVDGLPDVYSRRRGDHFAQVESAIRAPGHPPVAIIYTIGADTAEGLEPFLRWVKSSKLPTLGVMIYFHTPYYGKDELYLDAEKRSAIIDMLLRLKREGLPLINSTAGLRMLQDGRWPRRLRSALVVDGQGEAVCCRAADEVCPDCGYSACTEIAAATKFRPSAVLAMARYL